jgi:hypothetical protein
MFLGKTSYYSYIKRNIFASNNPPSKDFSVSSLPYLSCIGKSSTHQPRPKQSYHFSTGHKLSFKMVRSSYIFIILAATATIAKPVASPRDASVGASAPAEHDTSPDKDTFTVENPSSDSTVSEDNEAAPVTDDESSPDILGGQVDLP